MTGKIDPTKVPKDATTTTKTPKTGLGVNGEDKELSKTLKKQGLAVNKVIEL